MNSTSYHPIAKFCHWAIVLVVSVQFVSSWFMAEARHAEASNIFNTTHISGWSLLAIPLAATLLFMRFYKPVARPIEEQVGLAPKFALAMHAALYALLVVVPISGWMTLALRHVPVSFMGLFDLPVFYVNSHSFLLSLANMHGDFANILGIFALGHVAAALWHHFILRDSVLERMRLGRSV